MKARLLFRRLCQMKVGWDETVSAADAVRWKKRRDGLIDLNDLKFPRSCKGSSIAIDMQLHAFADASTVARGAVCYARYVDSDYQIDSSLLKAKSLLASLENHTVPKLELKAALNAVKFVKIVKSELKLEESSCIYWTDSTIVLQSLGADTKKFPVFLRNRLSQIEHYSCVYDWHHFPSALNPANQASRGCTAADLVSSRIWLNGPEFLKSTSEKWPQLRG